MSRIPGGYRGTRRRAARRPTSSGGRAVGAVANPPETEGDLMGVVWGEGEGPVNQRGRAAGADISVWIVRLIRVAWRRFFMHGGDA